MSVEPSSVQGRPQEQEPVDLASGAKRATGAVGIRHQAARIIDAVLADTTPEHANVREMLRQQLAAHPGQPERALAEHLAALKAAAGPSDE
jgi:hypothetical protein